MSATMWRERGRTLPAVVERTVSDEAAAFLALVSRTQRQLLAVSAVITLWAEYEAMGISRRSYAAPSPAPTFPWTI